jgi:glycerol-3-phosphate dehydrogenase
MRLRPIPPFINTLPFDLIVIGAGINGVGVARDAAMRGLKVLALDKGDIGSGTSACSSRLIHGGLRYLEYAEIDLVRESLRERERLFRNAPHLVKPLSFVIPLYDRNKRPPWLIKVGMLAYDILSYDKSVGHHHMLSRDQTLQRLTGLNPEGLKGAAHYYDGQVELAERLCVENALSTQAHGAVVLTYTQVKNFILNHHGVCGVEFIDLFDGNRYRACAPVTLNISGPWVDEVLKGAGRKIKRYVGGTKGSHIVVDAFPGAPPEAIYLEAYGDGRPIFIMPWAGRYLIGTTDIRYEGNLDEVKADDAEIDYLLNETNSIIPGAKLTRSSVLYSYSGIRPLPYQESGSTGSIIRRHIIKDHAPEFDGLLSVIGGKLTTYRALAEQAVDKVFKKLGKKSPPCSTQNIALPGANTLDFAAFGDWFKQNSGLSRPVSERLLRIYGTRSTIIAEMAACQAGLKESFCAETGAIKAEVLFAFHHEMACTLADALLRRTMVGLDANAGLLAAENAAAVAQQYLGWTDHRAADEIAAYRKVIKQFRPRSEV